MLTTSPENFYEEVGSRIREARIKAGISQEILGNQLGLTRASVINLEKGRHRPSLFLLVEIANFLMVHYTSLIPVDPVKAKSKNQHIDFSNLISSDPQTKSTEATLKKFILSF